MALQNSQLLNTNRLLTILAILGGTASAAEAKTRWVGENDRGETVEFRQNQSDSLWSQFVDGDRKQYLRVVSKDKAITELLEHGGPRRYRITRDKVVCKLDDGSGYEWLAAGGWHGRGFKKLWFIPLRYHGRWGGLGNEGGKPVDALDRACKNHDENYETAPLGALDGRADSQLVFESGFAAVNPVNDMTPSARVKALGPPVVFGLKPAVYHTKPVLGVRVPIPVVGAEKLSLYAAEEAWNGAAKPVGRAIGKVARKVKFW